MAYSEAEDLLLGDLMVGGEVEKLRFVQDAADEIDARIGARYQTPLVLTSLANHSKALIKKIANHLATGRLIMAVATPTEDNGVQSYAMYLVSEAQRDLTAIANGMLDLVGATPQDPFASVGNGPFVANVDADSGVETFYRFAMGGEPVGWTPG